jgi:hypothetical protein
MEAGGSGGCHHYFTYPPWLSWAALPCPHGIDGAARERKIDIYFLLIKIRARLKILCIRIAPPHGAAGVQLKEADGAKRFGKGFFGLRPLQPPEIPQNRQRFLWKCLEKQAEIWKSLEKKAWRVAFVPPPLPPPATPRRRSRSGARRPLGARHRTGARTGRISTAIASLNRL